MTGNASSKAGVMIREDLTAGSRNVLMQITPTSGSRFEYRSSPGATSVAGSSYFSSAPPYWLKIDRTNTTFTCSRSVDGAAWTQVGTVNITMATDVYIGLAKCSGSNTTLATATFDNLTATP